MVVHEPVPSSVEDLLSRAVCKIEGLSTPSFLEGLLGSPEPTFSLSHTWIRELDLQLAWKDSKFDAAATQLSLAECRLRFAMDADSILLKQGQNQRPRPCGVEVGQAAPDGARGAAECNRQVLIEWQSALRLDIEKLTGGKGAQGQGC